MEEEEEEEEEERKNEAVPREIWGDGERGRERWGREQGKHLAEYWRLYSSALNPGIPLQGTPPPYTLYSFIINTADVVLYHYS
ncbi:hypothetical protein EYF80_008015 [Liparis tanakae]|uniref:Uncharacterized protein n=1 Tax=Liparis tanakae TaxID=230148 RepID=A0A4Z2IUA5_9TELE|nr:hypothetical protein EYF80_008015 [Liparis tanakae]